MVVVVVKRTSENTLAFFFLQSLRTFSFFFFLSTWPRTARRAWSASCRGSGSRTRGSG